MSWKDTLRKAPFEEDELGRLQPTADTHPEVVEMFENELERMKIFMDNQDLDWEEKLNQTIEQLDDLSMEKYKAFFLKKPFYNKKINELKDETIRLTRLLQSRPERDKSRREFTARQLELEVEWPQKMKQWEQEVNQVINDMMVSLDQEPEGNEFQQGNV